MSAASRACATHEMEAKGWFRTADKGAWFHKREKELCYGFMHFPQIVSRGVLL